MVIRRHFALFAILATCAAAFVAFAERVASGIWNLFAPAFRDDGFRLAVEGPGAGLTGEPLDAGLLQSLRHEARTRRRSAARHC